MNRTPAISASLEVPIATHGSVGMPTTSGGRDLSRDDVGPRPPDGGVRSEDSATGKAEGDGIELRRCHALRMTQPHGGALADGQRDAAQAIGNLCRLEEDDGRIH